MLAGRSPDVDPGRCRAWPGCRLMCVGLPAEVVVSVAQSRRPAFSVASAEKAAVRYLARRDRTQAQMRGYLIRLGLSEAGIRHLLGRLARQGYLNDDAYALRWAEARLARRPMGRDRLEAELLTQGLDGRVIAKTLARVYGERSERDLAQALLAKRAKAGRGADPGRLGGLLRRHGFSEDVIQDLLGSKE